MQGLFVQLVALAVLGHVASMCPPCDEANTPEETSCCKRSGSGRISRFGKRSDCDVCNSHTNPDKRMTCCLELRRGRITRVIGKRTPNLEVSYFCKYVTSQLDICNFFGQTKGWPEGLRPRLGSDVVEDSPQSLETFRTLLSGSAPQASP